MERQDVRSSDSHSIAVPASPGSALAFFALTYLVAWACFVPVAAFGIRYGTPLGAALVTLGTFAPSLVALLLTSRAGPGGVSALVARAFQWQVPVRWYVFAAGYMVAIKLGVALIHRALTGAWPRFGTLPWYVIVVAIAFSTPVQAGEEIGWRGYALPRMAARMGLGPASVLLGVLWALWHLPLFFVRDADKLGQSFILYALQVTALSVAFGWLFARTNGSLLLTMLLHAAVNTSKDVVPSVTPGATDTFGLGASRVAWLTVAILWVCAAYFLVRMRRLGSRAP